MQKVGMTDPGPGKSHKGFKKSLSTDDLNEVYTTTYEARTKWVNILLALGIDDVTIQCIDKKRRGDPDECYRDGLSEWLKRGETTWQALTEALQSPSVGHGNLAARIFEQGSHSQFCNVTLETDNTNETAESSMEAGNLNAENKLTMPTLDLHQTADSDQSFVSSSPHSAAERIKQFERRFHDLRTFALTEVMDKNTSVDKFRQTLMTLPNAISKQHEEFIIGKYPVFMKIDSVEYIFTHLNFYLSFLDFSLLEHIIEHYGSSSVREKMKQYSRDMEKFRMETLVADVIPHLSGRPEPPPHFASLKMKLNFDPKTCTLEDLEQHRIKLGREVLLSMFAVFLVGIGEGSLIVVCLVPSDIVPALNDLVQKKSITFFLNLEILKLSVNEECLYPFSTPIRHGLPSGASSSQPVSSQTEIGSQASLSEQSTSSAGQQTEIGSQASLSKQSTSSADQQTEIGSQVSLSKQSTSSAGQQTEIGSQASLSKQSTSSAGQQTEIGSQASLSKQSTSSAGQQTEIGSQASLSKQSTSSAGQQTEIGSQVSLSEQSTSSAGLQKSLSTNDLKKVYKITYEARNKWENIVLELGIDFATIQSIGQEYRGSPEKCYQVGLSEWLKSGEATWLALKEALQSPTVGHADVATKIPGQAAAIPHNEDIQTIGDLIIFTTEKIGSGAFGVVFKGKYKSNQCAVKVLHQLATEIQTKLPATSESDGQDTLEKAFTRECKFLKSFKHPNVVQHLSTIKHPSGHTILVTELMDCNLRHYISQGNLSTQMEASISKDIASALAYIHSRNIIHRDLCGDNVLLKCDGPVPIAKISDFGMSRVLDPIAMSRTLTALKHRLGYLPPEAIDGSCYDSSLDIFSFGVIMIQIIRRLETVKDPIVRASNFAQITNSHPLKPLISDCLIERKDTRPTARHICSCLERLIQPESNSDACTVVTEGSQSFKVEWTDVGKVKWIDRGKEDKPLYSSSDGVFDKVDGIAYVRPSHTEHILTFNPISSEWAQLPQCKVKDTSLAIVDGKLTTVGGLKKKSDCMPNEQEVRVDKLYSLIQREDEGTKEWEEVLPAMPTKRSQVTAVSTEERLIVAGGRVKAGPLATVEILNVNTKEWSSTADLPKPFYRASGCVCNGDLYLVGGARDKPDLVRHVFRASISDILRSGSGEESVFHPLANIPFKLPSCVSIGGQVLAIGGLEAESEQTQLIPSKFAYRYDPSTDCWQQLDDPMNTSRGRCFAVALSESRLMVVGGYAIQYDVGCTNTVEFANLIKY